MIYVNKIENRITFKIKTISSRMTETIQLLESTKSEITKDINLKTLPHLEIAEVALINCNIVYNNYQQDSRVGYTFVPNKSFGQICQIFHPRILYFLKTFNSELLDIEVWFTDQNSILLEMEDKTNITLVIK